MATTNAVLNTRLLNSRFQLDFVESLTSVTLRELGLAGQNLQRIVQEYANSATSSGALKAINQGLAEGMQQAAVAAYRENVLQEQAAPSYRAGDPDRFAGGKLLQALEAPINAVGSPRGIGFINTGYLDQVARQWSRLNFGASPGTGFTGTARPAVVARVRFGSNQGFSLTLGGGLGTGFSVPQKGAGYFNSAGQLFRGFPNRADAGEVTRVRSRRSANGIAPRRYLDQGLVFLAENFGPAYLDHFSAALTQAVSGAGNSVVTNVGRA